MADFSLALKQINIFAKENNNKVILKVTQDRVLITTDATQYREGEVLLKAKTEGEDGEIALDSQFILDLVANVGGDKVRFELGEKTAPVVAHPSGNNDYTHIIMPLKL